MEIRNKCKVNHHYAKRQNGYGICGRHLQAPVCLCAGDHCHKRFGQCGGTAVFMVLIDDFITPLLGRQGPDFTVPEPGYGAGGYSMWLGLFVPTSYNRLMVNIGQGVQKRIRDEMFEHMQTLPIRYFDRHPPWKLMSRYTNDIDTLRQMINQALPMVLSSFVTIIAISAVMIGISVPSLSWRQP